MDGGEPCMGAMYVSGYRGVSGGWSYAPLTGAASRSLSSNPSWDAAENERGVVIMLFMLSGGQLCQTHCRHNSDGPNGGVGA